MSYEIYCEVNSTLNLQEYFSFRKQCREAGQWDIQERKIIREIYFGRKNDRDDYRDKKMDVREEESLLTKNEKGVIYQMVMEGRSEEIFMNQIRYRNGNYYKNTSKITREQCRMILEGEIDWMKEQEDALLYEFYFHSLYNNMVFLKMTESIREIYELPEKNYHISMDISRKETCEKKEQFLNERILAKETLREDEIQMVLRKEKKIPKSIIEIMKAPQIPMACGA